MTPTFDTMADLTLEQRNAALVAWLNDLTTVYEKCAAERDALRAALEAIRDYYENPAAVGAEDMTPAQKIGGMWSQAVAVLTGARP